jgi:hypothetical protein
MVASSSSFSNPDRGISPSQHISFIVASRRLRITRCRAAIIEIIIIIFTVSICDGRKGTSPALIAAEICRLMNEEDGQTDNSDARFASLIYVVFNF